MPAVAASIRRILAFGLGFTALAASPARAAIDPAGAEVVFHQARAICDRDSGAFWGRSLCGPVLLVDPTDRAVIANQADAGGVLNPSGGRFVGVLPEAAIVANTPLEWSGVRWTELLYPLTDDPIRRQVMLAHEMFHRIQPELKLLRPEGGNQQMDTLEGRYLLQLEWRALAGALAAQDAAARRAAIADALIFRHERYRLFPQAQAEEAALEIDEGVPEYTGVMVGLTDPKARIAYTLRDLADAVQAESFVRSFAYATGPAYGLLLDQADPAWRGRLGAGPGLDRMLAEALAIPAASPAEVRARIAAYDDGSLRRREVAREQARVARLAVLKARLVDGPVLRVPLRHASYQFNPQTLQPLGEFGVAYPTLRVSGDWGVLEAQDGALLDSGMTTAAVSAAGVAPSKLQGQGWRLSLNPGWTVQPGARPGDLVVKPSQADGN